MGEKFRLMRVTLSIALVSCLVYGHCSLMMLHTKCASTLVRYFKKTLVCLLDSWTINIFNGDNKAEGAPVSARVFEMWYNNEASRALGGTASRVLLCPWLSVSLILPLNLP